jgi:phosphohistidine phosphatase SixA
VNVFIMRHGEAQAKAETDTQRELAQQGREDIVQMAADYASALESIDVIWASPYVRTQQTAKLLAEQLGKSVITQSFLQPSGNPIDTLSALEADSENTVLIVSHQPLVGILVDGLAGLEPGRYRMGTGALACVTTQAYANGCCDLEWLHQPASVQPVHI